MPGGPARYSIYHQVEQQLVSDVTWCSLFQRVGEEATKPWVVGWKDNAEQNVPPADYWANIYIANH